MVGVVVGDQEGFAEDGLAVPPWDFREQIGFGIADQLFQSGQIDLKRFDAFVPGRGARRGRGFGPVVVRPFGGDVFRVAAEVEDVALRDAQMFEEHPGGMRQALWDFALELRGEIGDDFVKGGVGVAAVEVSGEVFAEGLVLIHES